MTASEQPSVKRRERLTKAKALLLGRLKRKVLCHNGKRCGHHEAEASGRRGEEETARTGNIAKQQAKKDAFNAKYAVIKPEETPVEEAKEEEEAVEADAVDELASPGKKKA